jgi:hypothetical protein
MIESSYNPFLRVEVVKPKIEGHCWLCGEYRVLTLEHTPPRSAFNDHDILLQSVDKLTDQVGHVIWQGEVVRGWTVRSLCGECNNWTGAKYGTHYAELIKDVAEKVDKVADGDTIRVIVNRPLSILKQVVMNYVSANGQHFVKTHPWLRKFLRNSRNQDFPPDWYVYAFAVKGTSGRKTGIGGFCDLIRKRICVVAEFTFWPLGTVLAFQPMDDYRLAPIHQYAKYDYTESRAKLILDLPVNPAASAYPVDFRSNEQIVKGRIPSENGYQATQEQGKEMYDKIFKYAAKEDQDDFIASGHPSTFKNLRN